MSARGKLAIRVLFEIPRHQHASRMVLAEALDVSVSSIYSAVEWLSARGYVVRRPVSKKLGGRIGGWPIDLTGKGAMYLEFLEANAASKRRLIVCSRSAPPGAIGQYRSRSAAGRAPFVSGAFSPPGREPAPGAVVVHVDPPPFEPPMMVMTRPQDWAPAVREFLWPGR